MINCNIKWRLFSYFILITMHLPVLCVTCTLESLERLKPQQVRLTGQRSQQTWMRSSNLMFVCQCGTCVFVCCRRNRLVFAPCRDDLMLWHVFKLQWRCVLFAFFTSLPSSPTCTFLWVKRVDKHGGMLMCWKELNEDGSALLGRKKMAVLYRRCKIFLPFSRFIFDTEDRNKIFEHTGIHIFYFKFCI